jgi:cytochrome c553
MSTSIERRAWRAQALVCIGLAATGAVAVAAPGSDPPSPPAATTRVRMAAHFEDLRAMQRLILGGDLDRVRERAREMVIERDDGEPATWAPYLVRMRAAAAALAQAESLLDACRAEARLARECAACHQASGAMPEFVALSPPVDQPTLAARMARHQWAADRLWEGVVGLSDQAWRDGLGVLAAAPLPASTLSADPEREARVARYARDLQRLARRALSARTPAMRSAAYGELLVVCSGCHSRLESEW